MTQEQVAEAMGTTQAVARLGWSHPSHDPHVGAVRQGDRHETADQLRTGRAEAEGEALSALPVIPGPRPADRSTSWMSFASRTIRAGPLPPAFFEIMPCSACGAVAAAPAKQRYAPRRRKSGDRVVVARHLLAGEAQHELQVVLVRHGDVVFGVVILVWIVFFLQGVDNIECQQIFPVATKQTRCVRRGAPKFTNLNACSIRRLTVTTFVEVIPSSGQSTRSGNRIRRARASSARPRRTPDRHQRVEPQHRQPHSVAAGAHRARPRCRPRSTGRPTGNGPSTVTRTSRRLTRPAILGARGIHSPCSSPCSRTRRAARRTRPPAARSCPLPGRACRRAGRAIGVASHPRGVMEGSGGIRDPPAGIGRAPRIQAQRWPLRLRRRPRRHASNSGAPGWR